MRFEILFITYIKNKLSVLNKTGPDWWKYSFKASVIYFDFRLTKYPNTAFCLRLTRWRRTGLTRSYRSSLCRTTPWTRTATPKTRASWTSSCSNRPTPATTGCLRPNAVASRKPRSLTHSSTCLRVSATLHQPDQ